MQEQIREASQIKIVSWPTPQDYNEAVQNPAVSFIDSELQCGQPELTPLGLPKPVSGMFASVYKLRCGIKDWAVRCFLFHFPDQHQRYEIIEQFLRKNRIPYMLGFDHQEEGLHIHGKCYPFLKMEWCYGVNLNTYIDQNIASQSKLSKVAEAFKSAVLELRKHGIAHGDLQHGNIMVEGDETGATSYQGSTLESSPVGNFGSDVLGTRLKLVDYDGVYVPELQGYTSNEIGHRNYQHPARSKEYFGPDMDNFSAWVIYLSLRALSIDPTLWQILGGGDESLLLRHSDFVEPLSSYAFHVLETHSNEEIRSNSKMIRHLLTLPLDQIPALDQAINTPGEMPELTSNAALPAWMQDAGSPLSEIPVEYPLADPVSEQPTSSPFWIKHAIARDLELKAAENVETQVPAPQFLAAGIIGFTICLMVAVFVQKPTYVPAQSPQLTESKHIERKVVADSVDQAMSAAGAYFDSGDFQAAISQYSEAIRLNPKLTLAYMCRAASYDQLKDYDKAIADYSKAIALNPKDPIAYSRRGDIYGQMDKFQKAVDDCTKALTIDGKSMEAYWYRGNAYSSLGQYQRAIDDYSELLKLNPSYANAFFNRGNAYSCLGPSRYEAAIKDYDQAIKLYPEFKEAWANRGSAHDSLGHYQKAVDDFTALINMDVADSRSYIFRAKALEHLRHYQKAVQDLSECIRVNPINADAHRRRAALYKKLGNKEMARLDREAAKRLEHP